jgi:hypothetical protein
MSGTIMVYPWREAAPAVQTYLETVAAQSVASNTFTFSGGPFGGRASWSPSADGSYNEMVPRDAIIAVRYYPAGFSTTDLTNLAGQVAFLQGKHDAGVSVAITISGSCVTNGQSNVDHSDEFVDLLYTCYKRMGDASIFSRYYANATNTLAYQFTTNGLIFLRPDQASRAGFGFEDSEAVYGYNAMCSLYRYRSCQQMGEMLTALGQTAEAQTYSNQMAAIRSSLMTNLWDGSRHLFRAGTISNATQHSIMASAYAVVIGAVSNDTALVIATRLKDMLVGGSEALAGRGGFLAGQARSMPEDEFWTVTEAEPGDYQNGGYWALGTAWCARAIALVDAAAASQLMADLGRRYYNLSLAELPYEWENPQTHSPARGALRYLASGTAPLGFYSTEPR